MRKGDSHLQEMAQFKIQQQNDSSFVNANQSRNGKSSQRSLKCSEVHGETNQWKQQNNYVHNQMRKSFQIPLKRLDPCLKSPKCPIRRYRSLRSIPNVEPVTPKKVTLESDDGIIIINGKQQPSIIPKLDLRRLTNRQSAAPRLPIARRTVLQKNDEIFQAIIRRKSFYLTEKNLNPQQDKSDKCEVSSSQSTPSSVSSFEIPLDCPPTPRGIPPYHEKQACPLPGQSKLSKSQTMSAADRINVNNLMKEINLLRTQSLDNASNFISHLKSMSATQFQLSELE